MKEIYLVEWCKQVKALLRDVVDLMDDLELDHAPDDYGDRKIPPEFMIRVRAIGRQARRLLQ